MLPSLKNKLEASASAPVEHVQREPDEEQEYDFLDSASEDLIKAVHSKSVKGVSVALRSAFEICESYPHEEGPHTEGEE